MKHQIPSTKSQINPKSKIPNSKRLELDACDLGFTLIEMLVAAAIFTFMVIAISGIYAQVLDLQRRAQGAARVQENALYIVETVAREVRVSTITSGDTGCDLPDTLTATIVLEHPVNGTVTYAYDAATGTITRDAGGSGPQTITSPEVRFASFAFCVTGSGADDIQARVTMPMVVESRSSNPANRVHVSLQTTVVSRDLVTDLTN